MASRTDANVNIPGGQLVVATESKAEFKLHILERNNYVIWKRHTLNVLAAKNLLETVENELDVQNVKERQARALLTSALSSENQMKVISCGSAYSIWKRLEATYENKTDTEKENLINKLHSYRIVSSAEISRGISEMETVAEKLRLQGEPVSNDTLISAILRALPKSFNMFVKFWRNSPKTEKTLDNLIARLMQEIEEDQTHNEKAFYQAGGEISEKNRSENRHKDLVCHHCKKKGHIKANCFKLKNSLGNESTQQNKDRRYRKRGQISKAPYKKNQNDSNERGLMSLVGQTVTTWIADSGASVHMTPHREWIEDYEVLEEPIVISGIGQDMSVKAYGKGKIDLEIGPMREVYWVPKASNSLLSESAAVMKGYKVISEGTKKKFFLNGEEIFSADLCNKVYVAHLAMKNKPQKACAATLEEWHQKLGHVNKDIIKKMVKLNAVKGLRIVDSREHKCEDCMFGKCHATSHKSRQQKKIKEPGLSLHFDTIGPMEEPSLSEALYALLCKDEFSGYRMINFVSHKRDIPEKVTMMINETKIQTGNRVHCITTDNGTEFLNQTVWKMLDAWGIKHYKSVPYTPQQNGFIERDIRTITESARTMLYKAKLPKALWAEAMNTAVYVMNRTLGTNEKQTPYEKWTGVKPDVSNLHIFGQKVVALKPSHMRAKFDSKGDELIFVGYDDRSNTYRLYNPEFSNIEIRCDVSFIDLVDERNKEEQPQVVSLENTEENIIHLDADFNESSNTESELLSEIQKTLDETFMSTDSEKPSMAWDNETPVAPRRVQSLDPDYVGPSPDHVYENVSELKVKQIPRNLHTSGGPPVIQDSRLRPRNDGQQKFYGNLSTIEQQDDPKSYKETLDREDSDHWKMAMLDEINSLKKNQVYKVVERPKENIVTSRWVFVTKRNPNGDINRYKARLVARGFSQIYGIDYTETYAPVVNSSSIRLLFAYASVEKLCIGQFDVKTAFLYGELEETIYMEPPEGFKEANDKVWLLVKSLYGLKQAPRQWNKKFTEALTNMKLTVSMNDGCIFYRHEPLLIIAIYVDDGIILARTQKEIDEVMQLLKSNFEMHTEPLTTFLGFQISRGAEGDIYLHQQGYIRKMLKQYDMENAKVVDNPCSAETKSVGDALDNAIPYREAVGSLMYASIITRLDIAYAVSKVSRKVSTPTVEDWTAVKRIFRYLKGEDKLSLHYGTKNNSGMVTFCDADFAGDSETAKSTTGFVILYGGGPISWKSVRQRIVSCSTTEAELESMRNAVDETLWLKNLAVELGIIHNEPIPIYCDNQSTVQVVHNEKSIQRTRNWRVKAAYIREKIEAKDIEINHVKGENQLADMLTKHTTGPKFKKNRKILMNLLTLLTALAIIIHCEAYVFDRVTPIIWSATDKYVSRGTSDFELHLRFTNPCNLLGKVPRTGNKIRKKRQMIQSMIPNLPPVLAPDDFNTALGDAINYCNGAYHELIANPLYELSNQFKKRPDHRPKVKRGLVEIITGVFISNLLSSVVDKLWHGKHEENLEERVKMSEEKLKNLNQEVNITNVIEKALGQSLDNMGKIVRNVEHKIAHMMNEFPHLVFTTNHFVIKMLEVSTTLKRFKWIKEGDTLDLQAVRELFPTKELDDIEPRSIKTRDLYSPTPEWLTLSFQAKKRDYDIEVYRVDPFRYWANLTETPVLMEYIGPSYLIFNTKTECIKGIENPITEYVIDTCDQPNGNDTKLAQWRRVLETHNPYAQPADTVAKNSMPYMYIYCYRLYITIKFQTQKCPPYVFRVNYTIPWNTSDGIIHSPRAVEYEHYVDLIPATGDVHNIHFRNNEHIVDENSAIDKIFNLTNRVDTLVKANIAMDIPVAGGRWSYADMLYAFLGLSGALLAIVIYLMIFRSNQERKRNETVLRTVIDTHHGDGTYDIIRETNRRASRSSTSVQAPSQINFNVNSGPALPPRGSMS